MRKTILYHAHTYATTRLAGSGAGTEAIVDEDDMIDEDWDDDEAEIVTDDASDEEEDDDDDFELDDESEEGIIGVAPLKPSDKKQPKSKDKKCLLISVLR